MSEFFDFLPEYTTKVYKFGSHEPGDAISVLNPRLQMLCNNIAYLLQFIQTLDEKSQNSVAELETEINQNLNRLEQELYQECKKILDDLTRLIQEHKNNYNNPHTVTKSQIGLGNVDNTSDENKPISTATQTALNGKSDASHTHTAAQIGAVPTSRKINGKALSSDVTLCASDVGLGNVNNTSDANKPISTAMQTALNGKASSSHTHSASSITQDSSHRFVTDSQKSTWNGKADASHTHTKNQITNFPTSLPASDVYSWAKASQKPSYTWYEIKDKPSSFTPASHTHNYSSITSGVGSDYTTYRVRDIALLSYTPSYLGNGQIVLVYT